MATGSFKITVAPDGGNFKIDVEGVVGTKCTDLTKSFEIGEVLESEKKPEYFTETEEVITVGGV